MASNNAPQPSVPPADRAKNFLVYGFLLSIVLHAIGGPFLKTAKTQVEEDQPQKVTVVRVPTPPPTPPPTPTPKPTVPPTPPPQKTPPPLQTPAPQQPKIKINTQKTESKSNTGPTEQTNQFTSGNTQGIPQGQGTAAPSTAPPATPAPATPTPRPPTPTPPTCSRPNAPPQTIRAVAPDTPTIAAQQGIAGVVEIGVSLDANSKIVGTRILSSPSSVLNQEALRATRQSTFQTETRDCHPVAAEYRFSVEFVNQ